MTTRTWLHRAALGLKIETPAIFPIRFFRRLFGQGRLHSSVLPTYHFLGTVSGLYFLYFIFHWITSVQRAQHCVTVMLLITFAFTLVSWSVFLKAVVFWCFWALCFLTFPFWELMLVFGTYFLHECEKNSIWAILQELQQGRCHVASLWVCDVTNLSGNRRHFASVASFLLKINRKPGEGLGLSRNWNTSGKIQKNAIFSGLFCG